MYKGKFSDIVLPEEGFLRGPFGSALKKSLFVSKAKDTYKVYEQGVVLQRDKSIGRYYISKKYFDDEMSRFEVKSGDFLVSCSGVNYGAIYQLKGEIEPGIINQALLRIRINSNIVDENYFLYYFKTYIVKKITGGTGDSTIPNFPPMSFVKNIDIEIPDIETQKKIGDLLKELDNKKENNIKINVDLETMAKTIYDYWFLQFDFLNEDGKPYKSSGGKMMWSEELKREIPEGWEVCQIKDCIQHINTGLNPRDNFKLGNGNIKYITVKNLTTKGSIDFSGCDVIDEVARDIVHRRSQITKGDILFASIAPLGRCFIIQEEPKGWDINESVFSIRPDFEKVSSAYLYMFFMSDYFIKKAEHSSTGSIFSGIRISVLEEMYILVPDKKVLKRFDEYVSTILFMKYRNEKENLELDSLQNFILPLLMNGQVYLKK